jgi:hypothetical protein
LPSELAKQMLSLASNLERTRGFERWQEAVVIPELENGLGVESGPLYPFLLENEQNSELWIHAHRRLMIE